MMRDALRTVAVGILTVMATGGVTFIIGMYSSINSLEARVDGVEDSGAKLEKQVDDIHWFLIKRNKVKVPE